MLISDLISDVCSSESPLDTAPCAALSPLRSLHTQWKVHPMPSSPKPKPDLYQTITDQIISQIEAGTLPWAQPWTNTSIGLPHNTSTRPERRRVGQEVDSTGRSGRSHYH